MLHRIVVVAGIVSLGSLHAQNAGACTGVTIPQKPVGTLPCQNAVPVCLSDPNGNRGRWVWSCRDSSATTAPPAMIPPTVDNGASRIPLGVQPAQINSPTDSAMQAERLRQLRLQNDQNADAYLNQLTIQNQQMQQQIDADAKEMSTQVVTNKHVLLMVQDGRMSENGIVRIIMTTIPNYSLAAGDIAALKTAGATDRIIAAMQARAKAFAPPASTQKTQPDLQDAYTCGYFEGMIAELKSAGLGADPITAALRETLSDRALGCDEIHKLIEKAHPTK